MKEKSSSSVSDASHLAAMGMNELPPLSSHIWTRDKQQRETQDLQKKFMGHPTEKDRNAL